MRNKFNYTIRKIWVLITISYLSLSVWRLVEGDYMTAFKNFADGWLTFYVYILLTQLSNSSTNVTIKFKK